MLSCRRVLMLASVFLVPMLILALPASAEDWARFRGPNGIGISTASDNVPTEWSPTKNLKWSVALPGPGVSSPIVVGDRVFVTCYSGYGINREEPGDIENLKRHLVGVDRETGTVLLDQTVDAVLPEDPYTGIGVTAHGYASHTPVSDGERVYAFFGKSGVVAFDLEGNQLWQTSVGVESDPWSWGSSCSPILYQDTVIVTAAAESQAIVGLDKQTGEELWRQEATALDGTWSTPLLVEGDGDQPELVLNVADEVWGLNPESGKLIWYCATDGRDQASSSAVAENGVVYAISGREGSATAVKTGGEGDVTDSHVVWSDRVGTRFSSPLLHEGKLYLIAGGILRVLDAESGDTLSQARLSGGAPQPRESQRGGRFGGGRGGFGGSLDYASPVIAGDRLFYTNSKGETFVFRLGEDPEPVAVNRVTEADESFGGTPAVSDDCLFLRSDKRLYCVGKKQG